MGLAASVLALTTVGGLATTAYLHQRQARAAQVELALNETTLLHDQARRTPDDLGRWQAAGRPSSAWKWHSAMTAIRRRSSGSATCAARSRPASPPRAATASGWTRWPRSAAGIWASSPA